MVDAARVDLSLSDRRAILRLTGRGGTNAMDLQMVQELDACTEKLSAAASSGEVDLVIIRAEGRAFCVGGDLHDFSTASDVPAHVTTMTGYAHRAIHRLHALEVPVIVRLAGAVAGGGIGLVVAGDLVIAARTASLTAGYATAGLTPDAGVSWALPRIIGTRRYLELMLTNRRVGADELQEWGVVARVVEPDALDEAVEEAVSSILRLPRGVVAATKRFARVMPEETLRERLDLEAKTIARFSGSPQTRDVLAELTARRSAAR